MNLIEKSLALGLIFSILFSFAGFKNQCENINSKVFRLHILANSDSKEDQDLKLKVRDKILEYSKEFLANSKNKQDAKLATLNNIKNIKKVAMDEIKNQGYQYPVDVQLTKMYFNTRKYGEITMPAGQYEALRILIGEAKGKNWWCVMFPPICLGAAKQEKKLDDVLTLQEKEIVEHEEKYEIKFIVVEWFEKIKDLFCEFFHCK